MGDRNSKPITLMYFICPTYWRERNGTILTWIQIRFEKIKNFRLVIRISKFSTKWASFYIFYTLQSSFRYSWLAFSISHSAIFPPLDIFLFLLLKDNCNICNPPLQERRKKFPTRSAAGTNRRDRCRRQIRQFVKGLGQPASLLPNNENFWRRRWRLDTIVPEDPEPILLVARRATSRKRECEWSMVRNKKANRLSWCGEITNVGMTESWW